MIFFDSAEGKGNFGKLLNSNFNLGCTRQIKFEIRKRKFEFGKSAEGE